MGIGFGYDYIYDHKFGKIYRPTAKVSFHSPHTKVWSDYWLVVDTGADFTILPRYAKFDLEISLERDCEIDYTQGVGGTKMIYLVKNRIIARIGNEERKIPLAFFDDNELPGLLGRLGFLETFDVEFLKSHTVVFKP